MLVGFDDDDVMNLHFAWHPPLGSLILSNLVPFTPFYRPFGAAYYRVCFAIFGWNPLAFRFVTFAFLLVNLYLVYRLARKLTNRPEVSALSVLIFSFHPKLKQIYMSNGAVYDVLCGTLSLLTLLYYMHLRETRAHWKRWEYAAITALFIAALNAKEMAAILPAIFLVYEYLYHPPAFRNVRSLARWMWNQCRVPALFAVLVALAFWGKRQPGGAFFQQTGYATSFTAHRFFEHERRLISELFQVYGGGWNTTETFLFYLALFLIAAVTRKKYLWFCAWFALLTPLPVVFIPFRGFFVMYLPMAGWAIFAAAVAVEGRDWLWRVVWKRAPIPDGAWQPERIFTSASVAAVMLLGRNTDISTNMTPHASVRAVAETHDDLMRLHAPIPAGAQVLLLRCPYPDDSWGPLQMMQLLYRDRNLVVSRPTMMQVKPDESAYANYDRVIDFNGRDLVLIRSKASTASRGRLPD